MVLQKNGEKTEKKFITPSLCNLISKVCQHFAGSILADNLQQNKQYARFCE